MTGDLVARLKAGLDEDEAAAKAAPGDSWYAFTEDDIAGASVYDEQWVLLYPVRYDHNKPLSNEPGATGPQYIQRSRDELAAHIARHDPARALREVAAKRAILALHEPQPFWGNNPPPLRDRTPENVKAWYCQCQCPDGVIEGEYPCETVRLLATAVHGDDAS